MEHKVRSVKTSATATKALLTLREFAKDMAFADYNDNAMKCECEKNNLSDAESFYVQMCFDRITKF